MDLDDEDLFAVFDSESSKAAKSGLVSRLLQDDQEDATDSSAVNSSKPVKFDTGRLVAEICGGGANSKRTGEQEITEEGGAKKLKTEAVTIMAEKAEAMTLMTGLSDQEVERTLKGESDWETQE